MRTRALVATLLAAIVISTGCTGMRSRERGLREPVQLPAAPKLERTAPGSMTPTDPSAPNASGMTAPGMNGPAISPLSATSPVKAGELR